MLVGIALLMTVGVYGLVAGIVKLDDAGLHLSRKSGTARSGACTKLGAGIVKVAPYLMKGLSIAGTAAMFLVGGSILTHGVSAVHHRIEEWAEGAGELPGIGVLTEALTPMLLNAAAGIVAGAVAFAIVTLFQRFAPEAHRAHQRPEAEDQAEATRAARRDSASHSTAPSATASTGIAPRFIFSHPADDTSAPDANDETPIVANMMKSFAPCVLRLLGGRVRLGQQRRAAGVHEVPADADQDQRARGSAPTVSPASATTTQLAISTTPATMIVSTPKRLIRSPVTNPGAYMPTTCHWITIAACAYGCEQKLIASGVATISRFIRP